MSAAPSRVRLDFNSPEFQDVLFRLELEELKQVVAALRRLRELDWSTLYQHKGFHEVQGHRLSPEELGLLAKKLANAKSAEEAARVRELITRGFYGI